MRREVACAVLLWSGAGLLPACFQRGTKMQGKCKNLPTVEECQATARKYITDECLRDCVIGLCGGVTIKCGADEEQPHQHCDVPGGLRLPVGGYVPKPEAVGEPPHTCTLPRKIIDWCELDVSSTCASEMMVHELSHACGWPDGGGKGVPGSNRTYQCDDFNLRGSP